ncbi:uncharacterized protein [Diadema setosum]|uniref:uncharacterized protein n=1 Tax=Diadema setosum TaxID=31175 RepID=UPI003B3ABF10
MASKKYKSEHLLLVCTLAACLLFIFASFCAVCDALPARKRDDAITFRNKRSDGPCLSHSDCLPTQSCEWDPGIVELAGRCVSKAFFRPWNSWHKRPLRARRRTARSPSASASVDAPGIPVRAALPQENNFAEPPNKIPEVAFPIRPSAGIDSADDVVVDHFDEHGLPVVVITEDNRETLENYDAGKDFNVFAHLDDKVETHDTSDEKRKFVDYDERYGNQQDIEGRHDMAVDLVDERERLGAIPIFRSPWLMQPKTGIGELDQRTTEGGDEDFYFNDDARVYGVGDDRNLVGGERPTFEHRLTDYRGTGIEMDVGVADILA